MYGQCVTPQTQNKRTSLSIRNAMRHTGVRVAAFGVCILMAGLLLLPGAALAAEMPEPDTATPITCDETNTNGNFTATTVVDHYYDLELPPAFMLIQNEAFVYDFPDKPEDFSYGLNDTVHLFKVDTDTESLIKTENPKRGKRLYRPDHDRQSRKSNRSLYRRLRRRPNPLQAESRQLNLPWYTR